MTPTKTEPTATEPTAPWNEQPAVKYDTPLPEAAWVAWAPVALPVTIDVYSDEDPMAEPERKTMLVPWNLTLRGNDITEALDMLTSFAQVALAAGAEFITDKTTWRKFELSAPKQAPVDYASLVAPAVAASPLPVAQPQGYAPVAQAAPVGYPPVTQTTPTWTPPPPAVTGMPAATQMSQPGSDGYGEFLATQIKVSPSFDKKRLVFRMAGEQWSKYGITCWEDTLNAAGINTSVMQRPDDYGNIGTWKCVYSLKPDGKPDLVVHLERVA